MSVDTNKPLNPDDLSDSAEDWKSVGAQLAAGAFPDLSADGVADMIANGISKALSAFLKTIALGLTPIATVGGKALVELEEPILPIFAAFLAPIISNMFGSEAGADAFTSRGNRDSRGSAAAGLVDAYMTALAGDTEGELGPSDEGAKRIAGAGVHAALEGWFNSWVLEMLGDMVPWEWLKFKDLTKLPEDIISALGVGRLTRRAFAPLVDATAATPMKRFANQKYRPNLLSEGDIVRAFISGDYTNGEASDELAQLGYSDKRQDILLKHATKFLSAADALVLVRDGLNDRQFALDNMKLQGYDDIGAQNAVLVEDVKHLNAIRDDSVAAIRAAYVDRRIDDGALNTYLSSIFASDEDRSAHVTALQTIRDLNTKRLTPAQVELCVKAKVLAIADYREALRLDGYDETAVFALELLLETELNAKADVEKLRATKIAERAAAQLAAAAAAAKKLADVEAQRAMAQRGSLTELARAVVRGLIPTSRYVEVLTAHYDADTVATLVALVEQDRAAYVVQQQKAVDATKKATLRHIDVGALQTAYVDGVLTLDQVRQQLASLTFPDVDATILLATMQVRKADLDAAKVQRAAAAVAAKKKSIDLVRLETLVRRGHRTIADYTALLASLGFDEASQAAMVDLLQLHIADDQAARDARAAIAAKSTAQGLSLDQARRGVILGVTTIDDFQRWLAAHKFTIDAQVVLLAELRDDVAQADAARAKRTATAGARVETRVPLTTVARAARLGVVSPDVYQQRLVAAGYTPDDLAIEMDLLAVEITDVQAARARAAAAEAKTTDRGLSLDQVAKAVKLGDATIGDYRARAGELGYAADDIDTLVAVLTDEVQTIQDATARHTAIDGQLTARSLSLKELDTAVTAGQMTIAAYTARLEALGFGADDAALLTTLLTLKLPAAPAGG